MTYSADEFEKEAEGKLNRILNRDRFYYFLDLEVKRSRRYQNFFCILILKLNHLASHDNGKGLNTCYEKLTQLLKEELRESDILGALEENRLAALLPYADISAGDIAKSRFEGSVKYFDFKNEGYDVLVDQICFPLDGTDTAGLINKVMGTS
jgi:GGDEF domain-containing protein